MDGEKIRYTVIADVIEEYLNEYLDWLKNGHVQALIDEGGAESGEVVLLDGGKDGQRRVSSNYIFPSREVLDTYTKSGVASRLRGEGIVKFVETKKVVQFERLVGPISFYYSK